MMGYKEKEIINDVLLDGNKKGRLFRGNAGKAFQGKIGFSGPGKVMLLNPRIFHGLPAGFPDVFGWEKKTLCELITENGSTGCCSKLSCEECNFKNDKIAIFKAVECKTGKQTLSFEQKNFKNKLLEDGGIYEEKREK